MLDNRATVDRGTDERGESSPRPLPPVVLIAASAGGPGAIRTILEALPAGFGAAVIIVQHRAQLRNAAWLHSFQRSSSLPLEDVEPGARIRAGTVYLAPAARHAVISPDGHFHLRDGHRVRGLMSSANPLFESAARVIGRKAIAVVLSGSGVDATDGVQEVKACGGYVIVQDRETSKNFGMPGSALRTGAVDEMLPIGRIGPRIVALVAHRIDRDIS